VRPSTTGESGAPNGSPRNTHSQLSSSISTNTSQRSKKTLRASIAASSGAKSRGALSAELRDPLDLTVLLPHFRGFLSTTEQHAPPALRKAAHEMALLPSDSWIASLEAYWQHAGKYDQQVGAFAQFLARAFLQPYAEFSRSLTPQAPMVITVRVCPLCGSRPLMGVLRVEGDSGKRFLLCSFCSQEWEFRRIHCPTCGEQAEGKLPVYVRNNCPTFASKPAIPASSISKPSI